MTWFRRRPMTPLPRDPANPSGHERAIIAEARALTRLPSVVIDLLHVHRLDRYTVQAALESDPRLSADVQAAWGGGPWERLLAVIPVPRILDRVLEVAVLRRAELVAAPLEPIARRHRSRHLIATAGDDALIKVLHPHP